MAVAKGDQLELHMLALRGKGLEGERFFLEHLQNASQNLYGRNSRATGAFLAASP